jgi:glutathione S-transferase
MPILRTSKASPFGRKVVIAADSLGLGDRITIEAADTTNPADSLRGQNPLGKIPVLILEDGACIYDSRVILEYLDHLAGGGRIIPTEPTARFATLTRAALIDGLLDATLLCVYEGRFRPEELRSAAWVDHQMGKVERALATLDAAAPSVPATITVAEIGLACALGYLDLRFAGAWRANYPALVAFLDAFAARVPAFAATRVEA